MNTTPFSLRRKQLGESTSTVWSELDAVPATALTSSTVLELGRRVELPRAVLDVFERILVAPARPCETSAESASRKEREVLAEITRLTPVNALQLQRLIETGEVRAFERLAAERRQRIVRALQRHRLAVRCVR